MLIFRYLPELLNSLMFLMIYIFSDWNLLALSALAWQSCRALMGASMFRTISTNFSTANSTASVAAAALVAGMAVFWMPAAPKAEAQAIAGHSKADRLSVLANTEIPCTLTSWPNYEANCRFDLRASSGGIRTVRNIALR